MRTVASKPFTRKAQAAPVAVRSFNAEFWLVFAMLLATTIFPAIAKYRLVDPNTPESSPAAQLVWSAMYLAAAFRLYAYRARTIPLLKKSVSLVVLLGYMLASVLWSVLPWTTFANAIELIGTAMIAYYIVVRFSLREFLEIVTLLFGVIALACFAMIFGAPGHGRMDYGAGAWTGIFQEKNNLAAAMSLGLISSLALVLGGAGKRSRWLGVVVLLLCGALLAGSKSATATVATVAALVAAGLGLIIASKKMNTTARVGVLAGLAIVAGTIWAIGITPSTVLEALGRSETLTGRADFWPYLQQAIADNPIAGYGYNAFFRSAQGTAALSTYVVEAGGWSPYHAHNSFLQTLLDGGFIALGLLLWVVVAAFIRTAGYIRSSGSLLGAWPFAIIVYLIAGSFTETYLDQNNTFEMLFFVVALLYPLRAAALAKAKEQDHRAAA